MAAKHLDDDHTDRACSGLSCARRLEISSRIQSKILEWHCHIQVGPLLDVQKTLFERAVVFVLECRLLCGLDTLSIYPLSAVLERWLPFRQEGGHPFLLVIKSKRGMKGAALENQPVAQR